MYRIETKGYDLKQKTVISNDYLLPSIRKQVCFDEGDIVMSEEVMNYIIEQFTNKEHGVRNLKRCLEVIHTKLNLCRLVTPENKNTIMDLKIDVQFPFTVTKDHIDSIIKKNDSLNPSLFGLYV